MSKQDKRTRSQRKKDQAKRPKKTQDSNGSIWSKILKAALIILAVALVAGIGIVVYWIADAPEITQQDLEGNFGSVLVDAQGEEYYSTQGEEREALSSEEIPDVLRAAVLSIEDQRFYEHNGIDPIRIGGAVVANFRDGYGSQGGSTITQQLVKLSVFSTSEEHQNLKRKVQEAWLALQIEREFSKEEILTYYINKVYMSDNNYGMGTAANYYFGKEALDLSLPEAALLAGMPQAPNAYNPYDNPQDALDRRNLVLNQMVDAGFIDQATYDEARQVPIEPYLTERSFNSSVDPSIDAYVKEVLAEVTEKTDIDPYSTPLTIHTNIDLDAQRHLYEILNTDHYFNFPQDDFQVGLSIVDSETSKVVALSGGRKQDDEQLGYNRATELNRSIGSVMKPLSTYAPAIEYEQLSTAHILEDKPYQYPNGGEVNNWDDRYMGDITFRTSLVESRNTSTMRLLEFVGLDRAYNFVSGLGLEDINDGQLYWANGLGGEVTPMQLSASYAAFANNGEYTDPYTVSKIVMRDGEEIDLTPQSQEAMSDYTAYMITDVLKDIANRNTDRTGVDPSIPYAAKTGTTNYTDEDKATYGIPDGAFPDQWFAGYSTNYSIAVWTGYDYMLEEGNWMTFQDPSSNLAREIFGEMMNYMSQGEEITDWQMPDSVVQLDVVEGSDPIALASSTTPENRVITELFVKGSEPSTTRVENVSELESEDESSEDESSEEDELEAPTGLEASYNPASQTVDVSWDSYPVDGATFNLSVGDQATSTPATSAQIANPPAGSNLTISLTASVDGQTSPSTSISINIPAGDEENEEQPDESQTRESQRETSSASDNEQSEQPTVQEPAERETSLPPRPTETVPSQEPETSGE